MPQCIRLSKCTSEQFIPWCFVTQVTISLIISLLTRNQLFVKSTTSIGFQWDISGVRCKVCCSLKSLSFLSPVASCAGQCPQYGWRTGWHWGTLDPQTRSHPETSSGGRRWRQLGPETHVKSKKNLINALTQNICTYIKYIHINIRALPVAHKAAEAEGVLSFDTPAACSLAEWKSWTLDKNVVRCSTGARRPVAPEHQSPWTLVPEATFCLAGMDEVGEMELEE